MSLLTQPNYGAIAVDSPESVAEGTSQHLKTARYPLPVITYVIILRDSMTTIQVSVGGQSPNWSARYSEMNCFDSSHIYPISSNLKMRKYSFPDVDFSSVVDSPNHMQMRANKYLQCDVKIVRTKWNEMKWLITKEK